MTSSIARTFDCYRRFSKWSDFPSTTTDIPSQLASYKRTRPCKPMQGGCMAEERAIVNTVHNITYGMNGATNLLHCKVSPPFASQHIDLLDSLVDLSELELEASP